MKPQFSLFSLLIFLVLPFGKTTIEFSKTQSQLATTNAVGPLFCFTSQPDTTSFPEVTLNFRILDGNSFPISPDAKDIQVIDNDQNQVSLLGQIQSAPSLIGNNYYLLLDLGNRSPRNVEHTFLQIFGSYFNTKIDKVEIFTNESNSTQLYFPGKNARDLNDAIMKFPADTASMPGQILQSLDRVLAELQVENVDPCNKNNIIILVMGDDNLYNKDVVARASQIKETNVKLVIFHLAGSYDTKFVSSDVYSSLTSNVGGIYQQVSSPENDFTTVLNQLASYHQIYSSTYRTNSGVSGSHNIAISYINSMTRVSGQSTYSIQLSPPSITLAGATTQTRLVQKSPESGNYIFDINNLPYLLHINWDDSHPRNVKNISLVIKDGNVETENNISFKVNQDNSIAVNLDLSPFNKLGDTAIKLQAKLTDEFGYQAISNPITVTLINGEAATPDNTFWLVWGFYLFIALFVLSLIYLLSKAPVFARAGKVIINDATNEIQQKFQINSKPGKPYAKLKIIEGPVGMKGDLLEINKKIVNLGRNPRLADILFYSPDINTSVSGLHARLEFENDSCRLVALSESGSETFINEKPIPFFKPVDLKSGQKIRMGYFAQQPVIFEILFE